MAPNGTKLRVAHVTTVHPPTDNRIFHKECVSLAEAGFDVHLVAVADRSITVDQVTLTALPRRRGRLARMLMGTIDAWRALRRIQPDLVHVHDPELVPLALFWRLAHKRPAVYDSHEDLPKQIVDKHYIPTPLRALAMTFARLVEKLADRGLSGIVVAEPILLKNYRNPALVLVQNFPWLRDFPEVTEPDPLGRTAAYIGGISPGRGAHEMMTATRCATANPTLVLAGPATPQSLLEDIERNSDIVDYLGRVPVAAIPDLLAASNVGLCILHPLPNYVNAQSTKIFEYMAAGRPFIASNFDSWEKMLGCYDCGLFVDPQDALAVAAAMDKLMLDPDAAREMGRRGRKALEENFVFENERTALLAFVNALLDTSRS